MVRAMSTPTDEGRTARVRAFYADYHARMGNTLGWPDLASARETWVAACADPLTDWRRIDSVLDVGSGEGHLLAELRARGFRGAYLGVELLDRPHRAAVGRYGPDPDATFVCGDFEALDLGPTGFDWVVSLGSLAVRQPDQAAADRRALARMVSLARVGLVLYVNDRSRVPPGELNDLPDLAAHDLGSLCELLAALGCPARNLRWYAADHSVLVHAVKLDAPIDARGRRRDQGSGSGSRRARARPGSRR